MTDTLSSQGAMQVRETVRRHSAIFLLQAVLLIIGGVVAFVYPLMTSLAVTFFLGWMLIVSGVIQAISLVAAGRVPHFWLALVSAVLSIVVGVLFIRNPGVAVTTLALLLVVYFMVEGMAKIVLALTVRPLPSWGWVLVSGLIGVALSIFLIMNPLLSFVVMGMFIGIQLIAEGIAIGAMAWGVRNA